MSGGVGALIAVVAGAGNPDAPIAGAGDIANAWCEAVGGGVGPGAGGVAGALLRTGDAVLEADIC